MLENLIALLRPMTSAQLAVVESVGRAISVPVSIARWEDSDFADAAFAEAFGLTLVLHHAGSAESFTKDKFEYAVVSVLTTSGHAASLAARGNRGHDVNVDGQRWSLKTQADANIQSAFIHISKFMELGRGRWETQADLPGLRDQMLAHMNSYDRIFTLRCLSASRSNRDPRYHEYELVEIPKTLLEGCRGGSFTMHESSKQNPKPGYCKVTDGERLLFELYFDGGTERKLQVRRLDKTCCAVHCAWSFSSGP